jgi:AcrR family transcriptional regulator
MKTSLWRKRSRESKNGSRASKGAETRRKILTHAMGIAAREGLAGLTIGRLARDLRMSKSGLFAHFRSKRALEMATINQARELFARQVLSPATAASEGIDRLWKLCDSWLAHIEHRVFAGGYFFTGAFFECAERSGAIEDEINRMAREWWETLRTTVLKAQERKEINSSTDARRISFDLNGILMAAYWTYLVEKDSEVLREARITVLAKLEELATPRIPASAFKAETTWTKYLQERHVEPKKKSGSIFQRLGGKKTVPSALAPSASSPANQPIKKSQSVFRNLERLTKGSKGSC